MSLNGLIEAIAASNIPLWLASGWGCPSPFLNRVGSNFALRHEHIRKLVCLPKPFSNGCLDFIAVLDVNDVIHLGLRSGVASSHLRSLQRATEEKAEFEKIPLGTHEEVAGLAREHDRLVRGVNPLVAEGNGCLAQPLPSIPQIVREVLRQSSFGGRPAVVIFIVLDPLLAVIALSTGHTQIVRRFPEPRESLL
jgi:hypothetical protein